MYGYVSSSNVYNWKAAIILDLNQELVLLSSNNDVITSTRLFIKRLFDIIKSDRIEYNSLRIFY